MEWLNTLWRGKTERAETCLVTHDLVGFLLAERAITSTDMLYDPFLMRDMTLAVERIHLALAKNERILIHGDYDVDGMSSTAMLKLLLEKLGADVSTFIPNRLDEGYGLTEPGLNEAINLKVDLVITVDCGIRSHAEVLELKRQGIDTIVTDHHEPADTLPDAVAVLDPHRSDETYPFAGLAGAGVTFKLCQALLGTRPIYPELKALACLGTVADVMALKDENRTLVKEGLAALKQGALPGVRHLLGEKLGILTARDLAFLVCPRLNAAGRMGDCSPALNLLLAEDTVTAARLTARLEELNQARKAHVNQALEEITAQVNAEPKLLAEDILVFYGADWHPGVLGIVAARVKEEYHKPSLIFSSYTEEYTATGDLLRRGSGRTYGDFDLLAAVSACETVLENYGGHKQALGLTVATADWPEFCRLITDVARQVIREESLESRDELSRFYDCIVSPELLHLAEISRLSMLEPFGSGNEQAICLLPNLRLISAERIGKEQTHLRLRFATPVGAITGIAFGKAAWADLLRPGQDLAVLGTPEVNEWRGKQSVQIQVADLLIAGEEGDAAPALADLRLIRKSPEPRTAEVLSGPDLVSFWQTLEFLLKDEVSLLSLNRLQRILKALGNCVYSLKQVKSMHHIFQEAGLIRLLADLGREQYLVVKQHPATRVKLSDTPTARHLMKEGGLTL